MTNYTKATMAQQIDGLRAAGAGSHPMRFDDYRRPMRAAMLTAARRALLESAGCPAGFAGSLAVQPISEWPPQARRRLAEHAAAIG